MSRNSHVASYVWLSSRLEEMAFSLGSSQSLRRSLLEAFEWISLDSQLSPTYDYLQYFKFIETRVTSPVPVFIFRYAEIEMCEDRKDCNMIGCIKLRTYEEIGSYVGLLTSVYFGWFDWIQILAIDPMM